MTQNIPEKKKVLYVDKDPEDFPLMAREIEKYQQRIIEGLSRDYNVSRVYNLLSPHVDSEITRGNPWAMVTHVQPNDSIIGLKMPGWGSESVRRAIEELKPDVHICGHIHETHGIEEMIGKTRVINVGKTGKIIEL